METWMENMLQDLNRISRVAVLEQAFETEKLLRNYTKLLKYRWTHENKTVIASMELNHIEKMLELYRIKWEKEFTYRVDVQADINSVFIPHYVFFSTINEILDVTQASGLSDVLVSMQVEVVKKNIYFRIDVNGAIPFEETMKQLQCQDKDAYSSFNFAQHKWMKLFGNESVQIEVNDKEYLKVTYIMPDNL